MFSSYDILKPTVHAKLNLYKCARLTVCIVPFAVPSA